ncbi:P-loop containing nucleoside triphosphate hydrolase protein [Punctularia strigosozonata HHB-11173 SS5]|uniref:p-loop containing nucleoside triphosphate hydrolase protein n=1 Tax=Punctularia strigosozonata (strain HHB-11173) TaxID=741275 RepID=R7S5U3_PUNST|nr:P-loop containing nucleoside triphosphate hydrolase protein [Punctularia strigosozonata HHB-11173 SS5]EIN05066.1 P-loop containing nucleoside triphosphate hydrolase protein [Punctularia strigosozonata HHB-11173 SS5]
MASLINIPKLLASSAVRDSIQLFLLGAIVESFRRLSQWVMDRLSFDSSVTARFEPQDPAHEWVTSFLAEQSLWRATRDFDVFSKFSKKIGKTPANLEGLNAAYIPRWTAPHLLKWRGRLIQVQHITSETRNQWWGEQQQSPTLCVTSVFILLFTRDMAVLCALVEEARNRYLASRSAKITVHTHRAADNFGIPRSTWNAVATLPKRPLNCLAFDNDVVDSLLADVREFLRPETEEWYRIVGISYHRGFLLWGSPGTGKTSTVQAIAGELSLEVYSLTLSSSNMDDGQLQNLVSIIPPRSILLLEDIDCAFPSREEVRSTQIHEPATGSIAAPKKSEVTLSGLLNVLDGVGNEGGLVVFATTNYPERLDAALSRPGRIDRKIEYRLASRAQARALFTKFFSHGKPKVSGSDYSLSDLPISLLADSFASSLPEFEFSTAQLQGYLLGHRSSPQTAANDVASWVTAERSDRLREETRRQSTQHSRSAEHAAAMAENRASSAGVASLSENHQLETPDPSPKTLGLDVGSSSDGVAQVV